MGTAPQDQPYHVFPYIAIAEAPDPPVPEEVDLTSLPWMEFRVDRYLGSTFAMTASLAGQGAALTLWLHAWKQPGICLPNDERVLARVCGLNWKQQDWKDIRDEALDKFYVCSNGRLYHPFISEIALEAWSRKAGRTSKAKNAAAIRWDSSSNATSNAQAMLADATRQDKTIHNTKEGTLSGKKARPRPKAPVKEIIGYLNEKAGTNFNPATKATIGAITARWQESKNIKRYKLVIDYLCSKWLRDAEMAGYLRPATIFQASKFEGYGEDAIRWADKTGYEQEDDE